MRQEVKHGNRLFDTHRIRKVINLNGVWDLKVKELEVKMDVPGCWEKFPQLANYRGKAVYTKEIDVECDTSLRFMFEGVSFFAWVYLDDRFLGEHYNAYTAFAVTAEGVKKGKHTLKVVVSNKFSYKSALHVQNDYYSYGGISRGVQMEYVGEKYIDNLQLTPKSDEDGWRLEASVLVKSFKRDAATAQLDCILDGVRYNLGVAKCGELARFSIKPTKDIEAWSPSEPNLYEVQAILTDGGRDADDLVERTGFRVVKCDKTGLYVNGKKIFIKGVNRHEDYNYFGCAVPFEAAKKDLDIIEELGANAIRTCHYPNDSLFLDMCDERGLLVWEETHSRGLSPMQMCNLHFDKQVADCGKEMIKWHIGHPSIVIWGCLNECASKTHIGKVKYAKHIALLRSLDNTRPVTFASCKPFEDKCLGLEDIVSYNLYYEWLNNPSLEETYPKVYEWTKAHGGENKPVIMSEFGAGAIFGYHGDKTEMWTEEKQRDCLEKNLRYYMNREEIIGVFLWQFVDHRVCEKFYKKRPGGINNKGIVNEFRVKKLGFEAVKEAYHKYRVD